VSPLHGLFRVSPRRGDTRVVAACARRSRKEDGTCRWSVRGGPGGTGGGSEQRELHAWCGRCVCGLKAVGLVRLRVRSVVDVQAEREKCALVAHGISPRVITLVTRVISRFYARQLACCALRFAPKTAEDSRRQPKRRLGCADASWSEALPWRGERRCECGCVQHESSARPGNAFLDCLTLGLSTLYSLASQGWDVYLRCWRYAAMRTRLRTLRSSRQQRWPARGCTFAYTSMC